MAKKKYADPVHEICEFARTFPGVEESTSCSQFAFKRSGTAFLYIGMQGGRCKMMVKLRKSKDAAIVLASEHPTDYQLGTGDWFTARFEVDQPLATSLWKKWLKESFGACEKQSVKKARRKS